MQLEAKPDYLSKKMFKTLQGQCPKQFDNVKEYLNQKWTERFNTLPKSAINPHKKLLLQSHPLKCQEKRGLT